MNRIIFLATIISFFVISCRNESKPVESSSDINEIEQIINDYDNGWESKNIEMVLQGYSDNIDWTNAFGDRTQGKEELRELLNTIFSLDFVMAGKNNYQDPDITFPNEGIALARSTNIRTGQKWPDGRPMDDRIINHLRVFKKVDGKYKYPFLLGVSRANRQRGSPLSIFMTEFMQTLNEIKIKTNVTYQTLIV